MFHGLEFRVDDLRFKVDVKSLVNRIFFLVKVNQKVINVFYSSLKMRVKVVSVNMKRDTLKIVFSAIFLTKLGYC